ncbi:hypothetical protein BDY17DRAFT_310619 [Neohortaea acidophila]|uniref:Uncharacterized protein n=1 Tax=Neohortaea acidophila TaxID=245834 RepID=A0A6A6PV98_9PEZI|nr:uncharacterized protein BDY17DRAFT_310619 [Neohortaea acidophila]KAF2483654.1 hypothetical protein BDY17DRAFT_310619 [Neohortaea acidophila]
MAPSGQLTVSFDDAPHSLSRARLNARQNAGSVGQAPGSAASSNAASFSHSATYLGVGLGVGGAFILGLIFVAILTVRKRAEHKRLVEAMEVEEALHIQQTQEVARPVSALRRSLILPLQSRAGWDALTSDESVNQPDPPARSTRRKRDSIGLPKKFRHKGIPLTRFKRLTAILESPRSRPTDSPAPDRVLTQADGNKSTPTKSKGYNMHKSNEDDVFVCPESPKPNVLPSFAIRSPGRYGAGIANDDHSKSQHRMRSGSMSAVPDEDVFGSPSNKRSRRSVSMGAAPPSRPPSGPVPPLPVISPHDATKQDPAAQGLCIQRLSTSSHGSVHSSVLATSPVLVFPERKDSMGTAQIQGVGTDDDSAATNQWHSSQAHGQLSSIRNNMARYSAGSLASQRFSSGSLTADGQQRRVSSAEIGTADQVSISRVSSSNSLASSSVRKVITPRKHNRTSVSASGSPAERKKGGVLRDISGNTGVPSRQGSDATQDSNRNSNPFQWDNQPLQKPSALKGSPNARKGHRRQNCVRISTLTPQILGPPPSRSTSPSITHGIEEESADGDESATQPGMVFVSNQRLSRPPSTASFAPNLRLQPSQASLTPSSPTLSLWNVMHEQGMHSQGSDLQLSAGTRSSMGSIPSFPSPVRAAASTTQLSQPIPEFYLSRPSTDTYDDTSSSPFVMRPSSDLGISSSPPGLNAMSNETYDPESPQWSRSQQDRSSASFPFIKTSPTQEGTDENSPPRSRPQSYGGELPDTPPISPKTSPSEFEPVFGISPEKLTSANASAIMAQLPGDVTFPGAPVLLPPAEDEVYAHLTPRTTASRQGLMIQTQAAPPPPLQWIKESCVPSPLQISGNRTSPTGPRSQPPQSVLKNAMQLRRMNSEIDHADNERESRRYVRLGREASPLLPWAGSPELNASQAEMGEVFDFQFGAGQARSGAEVHENVHERMESKLDGALAGLDAGTPGKKGGVWEDGEKYWNGQQAIGIASSGTPARMHATPPRKESLAVPSSGIRSIQNTPKSLYDSEGFLYT